MQTGLEEAGNFVGRQRKLKQEATHHIFPPLMSGSKTGAFPRLLDAKCGCSGHCSNKKRCVSSSAASCRSGAFSAYSEKSYSSYCSSCDGGCMICRSSPTHFCSCCRCISSTSLPVAAGLPSPTPITPRKCFSSSPMAACCCCCHHNRGRWGQRRGHVHIPESIAEEMEGEMEGEGGAAAQKRKCRKRGKKCSDLPRIHATGVCTSVWGFD